MGALFRSEEMSLCQLFIQPEAAYTTVAELGEIGIAQFRDLNPELSAFQRKFTAEVRRCDEMERKVNYIKKELIKDGMEVKDLFYNLPPVPNPREFIDLEALFEKTENEILELSENFNQLLQNFQELTELRYVLERTQSFFSEHVSNYEGSKAEEAGETQQLGFVAGVIEREKVLGFERILWRISRGNVFLRHADIETPFTDPKTGREHHKNVFVAFFQGDQLKTRVKKVCAGYHASLYPCPNNYEERDDMLKGVMTRLQDLTMVINQTKDQRQRVLVSVSKDLPKWIIIVKKIKAIYHTMNLFNIDVSGKCLIGECWIPTNDLHLVQSALTNGSNVVGSTVPSFMNVIATNENPPTFNRTNRFTQGFQNLIDAFGVANYREANPALYTIITFPFLFAIMFGDLGHGIIMFLFGLWMVTSEKKLLMQKSKNEIWNIFFGGRYIILLMGFFSMYTGLIYNDCFSKTMNIFGSSWKIAYNESTIMNNTEGQLQLNPSDDSLVEGRTYPFGLDPAWMLATNKIIFLNSFKMKVSIIFGVVHMIFGVIMSVVNYNHFRRRSSIILEFLPQILFLVLLFAYMVFMMFWKWFRFSPKSQPPYSPGCAPSVLIYFINMMLFGENKYPDGCEEYMFPYQQEVQLYFVIIALLCIPWMLLGKPLFIMCTGGNKGHGDHGDEPMSEIWIHQAIHTIEYVLNTISHTASYLRLWALSLAHAQLSEVLWGMVLNIGLTQSLYVGGAILFPIFGAWAVLTLAILVMMEGLSAFLHTLRLHWVEFMSKFYTGTGYIFAPFHFKTILNEEED
ncbi:hypothetical protein PVAND_015435 [Polypedilum vanderplanki]|uniref:V-type proton ATPase subunit a n=1 Tax=Polypedilum vanderplanki TaxID=319348 RepID=A0A9J6BCU0_POLVA|nr:hypothetical protein PVAND_015435 [Polypedilum vanderplanki]